MESSEQVDVHEYRLRSEGRSEAGDRRAMAQDVRPSPMAYPAVRSLPKLPLPVYGQRRALPLSSSTRSART
eukprot:scaffold22361_cov103-Phaeocystis_antarctica.AAC.1